MVAKVLVSFPENFLEEIDAIAKEEHRSRSELLREAVRVYIQQRGGYPSVSERQTRYRAAAAMDEIAKMSQEGGEESTELIHKWRNTRGLLRDVEE